MTDLAINTADLPRRPISAGAEAFAGFTVETDSFAPAEWDRMLADFEDVNLFQTAVFADGFRGASKMSHLVLRQGGEPVAGARVAIMKPPGLPSGVAYVKHGPFWRRSGRPADSRIYNAVVAAVIKEYGGRRGHLVTISPRPHPQFLPVEKGALEQAGFHARMRGRPITFFLVNTGLSEEALRKSLSQSWRHNLKLAERNELQIEFHKPLEALPDFLALHEAMIARKQFADREPLHLLPQLFKQLPASSCHIVTASHRDAVAAAAVIIIAGDVAYYLYGASADAALDLRAGYALHWRIARWLAEHGIAWYDLGDGFGHLRQFKQGFAGKSGAVIAASELDFGVTWQARLVGSGVYAARDALINLRFWRRRIGLG